MQADQDRRRHFRKAGQGLVVLLNGKAHPVVDISTQGVCFQGSPGQFEKALSATIARLDNIEDCIEAKMTVISSDSTVTRAEFRPTMSLMNYIIGHIGQATGAEPAYFRK